MNALFVVFFYDKFKKRNKYDEESIKIATHLSKLIFELAAVTVKNKKQLL